MKRGALVFGRSHVVLPLPEEAVVNLDWVPQDEFLAGYADEQATAPI